MAPPTPTTSSLTFKVTRRAPELIAPAKQTPREYKLLSDIDDQEGLRFHIRVIHFYRRKESMLGSAKDPVEVIREAIAKTLVFYYPLAGRLREGPGRKLGVDCTGEGVMFIEADADVRIEEFGDIIQPPFPCLEELSYNVPGSDGVLNCPLLLIQVLKAVAEMARGETSLSVTPIWRRELLSARDPPHVTCRHDMYNEVLDTNTNKNGTNNMVRRSFFFGPDEIAAIRTSLPPHHRGRRKPSTIEILTAYLWRCHNVAIRPDAEEEVQIHLVVNVRGKLQSTPLPAGYYGNATAIAAAISSAGKLCQSPLEYALELVMNAKDDITEEHVRSLADFLVTKGRPTFSVMRTLNFSDLSRIGFEDVDFGWGKAAYGGPVVEYVTWGSFYLPLTNAKGERGLVVPLCMPHPAMKRFEEELDTLLKSSRTSFIKPAL